MNKNIIIFLLAVAVIILGGILIFSNNQNSSSNANSNKSKLQPRIIVSEEEWDFGKVVQGEKPTHTFMVKNGGEGELIIERIKESCSCIEASISTTRLQSGDTAEVTVTYDTTDYLGKDEKHIHIYSNDPGVPDKRINLYVEIEKPKIPYLND
ncbi:MAG TPA: hypothetical protein DEG96_06150 [Candidatus Atribacteria bacterium]|nr:hypothetical protein [Candidatus Atribacteria bacterium]